MTSISDKPSKKLVSQKPDPSSSLKAVLADFRSSILDNHNSILNCFGNLAALQIQTGKWLRLAKNLVPHGQFENWFEEQFRESISLRTGQRYMKASRIAEEKMDELRSRLSSLRTDLDVSNMKDEEVISELPPSDLFEITSMTDDTPKKISPKKTEQVRTPIIAPELLQAVVSFIGPPELVLSSLDLTNDKVEATKQLYSKDPLDGMISWPQTAFVFLDSAKACKSHGKIKQAFDEGSLKECLVLLPTAVANGEVFQDCPHLAFNRLSPLSSKDLSTANDSLALLLVSENDRTPDFATAFAAFGVVKVPFKVKAK